MSRGMLRLGLLASTALLVLAFGAGQAFANGVDPASVTATLTHGQSVTVTKTVHTPAIPANPDIVFLSDTTGSMGGAIANVKTNATTIMNDVNGAQPPGAIAQFGAAEYKDGTPNFCPSDPFAFRLDAALTTSLPTAQAGINTWSASGGCDTPESAINALYQLATGAVAFRPGSTRVIVWFGDATSHDPSLGHTLTDAINALVAAHIIVIALPVNDSSPDGGLDGSGQATAIANATGGEILPSTNPGDVSNAILAALHNLPVTVTPSAACDSGLSATYDAPSKTVTSGMDVTFTETLTVASNAPENGPPLHCNVDFLLNGNHVDSFQETVDITVPDPPISATGGFAFSGTEPASVSGPVATFSDPDPFATASEYTATIKWGDGSTSTGSIAGSPALFTVADSHVYADEGNYTITVTISDSDNLSNSQTVTDSATVADAKITASCGAPLTSLQAFNGPVAGLVDANPIATTADFTAPAPSISWGDGTTTSGTVTGTGPFTVSGSHTYASTGFFTIKTTITDDGGSTDTTTCNVVVYAFAPGGGSFVIGDQNSANTTPVTFWGAQWWKLNSLSGGAAPASFKGFAKNPAVPSCGGAGWSTDPGNSAPPPAGPLPALMGVIVTSSSPKSGSTISGNIAHIVVVQTNPGYDSNPGHAGTGTVVIQVC
jgi:PKD domain